MSVVVAEDDAQARREIGDAMAQWSKQGVHLEHFYELLARTNLALYTGDVTAGLEAIEAKWRPLVGALLFRVQSIDMTVFVPVAIGPIMSGPPVHARTRERCRMQIVKQSDCR